MLINQVLFQSRLGQESNCIIFLTKTTDINGLWSARGQDGVEGWCERPGGGAALRWSLLMTSATFLGALAWSLSCFRVFKSRISILGGVYLSSE